jgi:hypothetical protein
MKYIVKGMALIINSYYANKQVVGADPCVCPPQAVGFETRPYEVFKFLFYNTLKCVRGVIKKPCANYT